MYCHCVNNRQSIKSNINPVTVTCFLAGAVCELVGLGLSGCMCPVCSGWLQRWWCARPWRTLHTTTKLTSGRWASRWSSWLRSSRPTTSSTPWGSCLKSSRLSLPPWSSLPSGKPQRVTGWDFRDLHHYCTIPSKDGLIWEHSCGFFLRFIAFKGVLLCSFTKSWCCFGGVLEHALMLGGLKITLFFTLFTLLQYISP